MNGFFRRYSLRPSLIANGHIFTAGLLSTTGLMCSSPVLADRYSYPILTPSQSDFGGVGLMQMPNARHMPEGELTLGASVNDDYRHYFLSLQLFPWLETTIRYTQVPDVLYSDDPSFSGDTEYTDKGIDFKLRLLEESYWLPETSFGVRDLGGTGLFDGEYFAANKQFGPVDVTLGVAWGYMGNSANLTGDKNSSDDCGRNTDFRGNGGSFDIDRWFTGCTSVFGGIEYQSPWAPLRLKLEYDANDYISDFPVTRGGSDLPQDSDFNYGILYRLGRWGNASVSYERGNTWTFGLSLNTNFNALRPSWYNDPKPKLRYPEQPRHPDHPQNPRAVDSVSDEEWQQLANTLNKTAGYEQTQLWVEGSTLTVSGQQGKYRDRSYAHQQAATLIANQGLAIETYRLVETSQRQPMTETHIDAEAFVHAASYASLDADIEDANSTHSPQPPAGIQVADTRKAWDVNLSPVLQQSFGGSENFYLFNVGLTAGANYWFGNHFELGGSLYLNLYDNYDKFLYEVPPENTDLKRVRTLVRQYINDNPVRINNLQLTWMDTLADSWYAQAYGGYLEMMFGGVGGEVLYRPLGSRWAMGVDLNYVVQRDPDTTLGFFTEEVQFDSLTGSDYRVQTGAITGHASVYYQPDWSWVPNLQFKISAGQYLTEDVGATLDISKQFDSGVIAGAFAAITDLSSDEFGEGSFNKGFYLSIPFDVMTVKPSTQRATISWLPLTRDGGQMLNRKYQLFNITDPRMPWYGREVRQEARP